MRIAGFHRFGSRQGDHGVSRIERDGGLWREYSWDGLRVTPAVGQWRAPTASGYPAERASGPSSVTSGHMVMVAGALRFKPRRVGLAPTAKSSCRSDGIACSCRNGLQG